MRFWVLAVAAMVLPATVSAQVHVRGYTKKDGTYVAPHYRSNPDGNVYNNWSTVGNVNPYTGQPGTKNPYGSYGSSYGSNNSYSNQYRNSQTTKQNSYGSYGSSYGSSGSYSNPYSSTNSTSSGSSTTCYYPPC